MVSSLNGINFASLFSQAEILCKTSEVERDKVFMGLLQLLAYNRGIGNVNIAFNTLVEREKEVPTIVAPGIAMPHARLEGVDNLVVAVATSENGIRMSEGPDCIAKLLILILVPKDTPGLYLQAVSSLSRILKDPTVVSHVSGLSTSEDVWRFFNRGGLILPDCVCAGDIMTRDMATMQNTDTLEHAIDMFVKHNLTELPVVDKDGDLVGMVTEAELLRVCLPDYILWMEDLSPIINFQPFAEVLRNEEKTWLSEIMSFDFVTVSEDAPAIQVAKEITKRGIRQVFVVREKKLVGMITLQNFINKVLRQ